MNTNKKRIMLVASATISIKHFRGDFIKDLIKQGFEVFAAVPDLNKEQYDEVSSLGAIPVKFNLQRAGLNPFKDIKTIFSLKKLIKEHKINLVFPYTIKPVIYGSIAANLAKVPTISLITGLGYTFSGVSSKARFLQKFSTILYRIALRTNKVVVFQNIDDYNLFLDKKIILPNQAYDIVSGSGVNLEKYPYRKKTNDGKKIVFVFVARLIKEKGIHLFIEAAKLLKPKYPKAEFHILGDPPKNTPSAISKNSLIENSKNGVIVHHGRQNNVQDFLHNSDVFVLPTYYREGVPRSSLECLSTGMPLIITDAPGCRETVIKDENGILIEPQNQDSLTDAMEYFLKNPNKIEEMGAKSWEYAKKRFDVKIINKNLIDIINSNLN